MARVLRSVALGVLVSALLGAQGGAQSSPGPAAPQGRGGDPAAGDQPATPPPAGAQPQDPTGASPVFRTGIDYVRVDVIVTDKAGNPVTDLKQEDFEVVENNQAQTID